MRTIAILFLAVFCFVSSAMAAIDVPADASGKTLEMWEQKENSLAEALNRVNSVRSSMQSYLRWAKDDPSAAKNPGSISDMKSSLESIQKSAETSAKLALKVPALDEAFARLAGAAKELQAVNAEAYKYYNRKDYTTDGMAKGKELHPQLVQAYDAFIAAAEAVDPIKQELSDKLEPVQLAQIDKKYGKKYYWHHINLMAKARAVVKLLPSDDKTPMDAAAFDGAVNAFSDALKGFEAYYEEAGEEAVRKEAMIGLNPNSFNSFLASCRELGQELGAAKKSNYARRVNSVVDTYNRLIDSSNRTRFKFSR